MKPVKDIIWGKEEVRLCPFYLQALKLFWCLRDLKSIKEGRMLDLGCGAGGMTKAIKFYRPDFEVLGCDINKKAIAWAKKQAGGVKFMVADAHELPFKDKEFMAIVSFDFFEHLKKPEKAINEAYRVLKPGGVFHIFVPLEDQAGSFYWLLKFLGWQGKKQAGHVQIFNFKSLRLLLERHGFRIKNYRFADHWAFQLVDVTYHLAWQFFGKRPVADRSLSVSKKLLAPLFNLESLILAKVPGGGVSIRAIKEEDR